MLNGIIYVMRSGCQWNRLPEKYGSDSTVHRTMQRWIEQRVRNASGWRQTHAQLSCCADIDELELHLAKLTLNGGAGLTRVIRVALDAARSSPYRH